MDVIQNFDIFWIDHRNVMSINKASCFPYEIISRCFERERMDRIYDTKCKNDELKLMMMMMMMANVMSLSINLLSTYVLLFHEDEIKGHSSFHL